MSRGALPALGETRQPRRSSVGRGTQAAQLILKTQAFAVLSFTVVGARIVEIEMLTDPERLRAL